MQPYLKVFNRVKKAHAEKWKTSDGLICKVGSYMDCSVIKLQKPHWTNDSMKQSHNTTGIFFAIWVPDDSKKQDRLLYIIEAKKLRLLEGYEVDNATRFAFDFREQFTGQAHLWPKVKTDCSPAVLMQGSLPLNEHAFEADTIRLMHQFVPLSRIIDSLLAAKEVRK
jgi:hypothetical protein